LPPMKRTRKLTDIQQFFSTNASDIQDIS